MTFDPDIADDCLLVDGTQTVTLHGTAVVSVAGAKRGPISQHDIELQTLGLEPTDVAWNLPQVNLAGTEPRNGDLIEEAAGTTWTIISVTKSALTGVWRAVCRRQR
jgi:hypothetical protein